MRTGVEYTKIWVLTRDAGSGGTGNDCGTRLRHDRVSATTLKESYSVVETVRQAGEKISRIGKIRENTWLQRPQSDLEILMSLSSRELRGSSVLEIERVSSRGAGYQFC